MPQFLDFCHFFIGQREKIVLEVDYLWIFGLDIIIEFVKYLQ